VRAMHAELGSGLSHAYLSQLESGARVHLSAASRDLLARFFEVHPAYLVDDPPGYQAEIVSAPLLEPDRLRSWLANRAEEQRSDPLVYRLLLRLSQLDDPRRYVALFDDLLDLPLDVVECLLQSATHEAHDASALQRAPAAVAGRGIGQR